METHFAGTRLRTRSRQGKREREKGEEFLDTSWRTIAMNFTVIVKMKTRIRKKKNRFRDGVGEGQRSHRGLEFRIAAIRIGTIPRPGYHAAGSLAAAILDKDGCP